MTGIAARPGAIMPSAGVGSMTNGQQYDRFRSFAERYIIARAAEFTKGKELEEGWQAIQDAKKLYQMTADASTDAENTEQAQAVQQQIKASMPKLAAQNLMKARKIDGLDSQGIGVGTTTMGYGDDSEALLPTLSDMAKLGITPPRSLVTKLYSLVTKGKKP